MPGLVLVALAACSSGDGEPSTATTSVGDPAASGPLEVMNRGVWPMHHVDGRFRGANALGAGDVNDDGHADYITNYEFDQRWIVSLHPGTEGDVRRAWPTVEVWRPEPFVSGNGKNPESTALGDVDGDGNVDAVGAHGFSDAVDFEGSAPGVHVVWGPGPDRAEDPEAWEDGGWVPSTVDLGHPHWVVTHDVDGDGLTDVAFGGRRHGGGGGYDNPDSPNGNGTFTGIAWLEAPDDPAQRRDLDTWRLHHIDPDTPSGHGFVFADLDADGDDDVVDANADFDTPQDAEEVAWYENPGVGADQERPWRRTVLHASTDFYAKPSVAVGDLDDDGDPDVVTQTTRDLVLFRNRGGAAFDTVTVTKPAPARWLSRPVRLADFDADGDLDVFGMLLHDENDLPASKAAAFLLLNEGEPFDARGWRFVAVKWGSGTTMALPGFGEKWDQVAVTDVDGDGDLDVVANCEEWWATPEFDATPFFTPGLQVSSVAIVWFENVLGEVVPPAGASEGEDVSSITIEAEYPASVGDSTWVERAPVTRDGSAEGPEAPVVALQALNGLLPPTGGRLAPGATRGATYRFEAEAGEYVLWARLFAPATFGPEVGGATADSAWVSVDRGGFRVVGDAEVPVNRWRWVRVAEPVVLGTGAHELTLRVRERGVAVDALVLSAGDGGPPSPPSTSDGR